MTTDPGPSSPLVGRRRLLAMAGGGLVTATLAACGGSSAATTSAKKTTKTTGGDRNDSNTFDWKSARKRLEDGNARFVAGKATHPDSSIARRKKTAANGQKPFASVLCCADSRVPPELVFDQGIGDLFVVRSAGEVVDHAVLGTLQFGVAEFGTPLLVVLGHTKCGAIKATIEALEKKSAGSGTDVDYLVEAITPAVEDAQALGTKKADLLEVTVDSQVERVVADLEAAKVLGVASKSRKLKILGAVYDISTGEVSFL